MDINTKNIEKWMQKLEQGILSEKEEMHILAFLENQTDFTEVLNDNALKLNPIEQKDYPNISFTHLANKAENDIEHLAFEISEGLLNEDEKKWEPQLYDAYPALGKEVEMFKQLQLRSNKEVKFALKDKLIKEEGKLLRLNTWVKIAAILILALGCLWILTDDSNMYQPRTAHIKYTPFTLEEQHKKEPVKEVAKKPTEIQVASLPIKKINKEVPDSSLIKEKIAIDPLEVKRTFLAGQVQKEYQQESLPKQKVFSISPDNNKEPIAFVANKKQMLEEGYSQVAKHLNMNKNNLLATGDLIKTGVANEAKRFRDRLRIKQTRSISILGKVLIIEPITASK